jgi:acyl carrier protein
VTTYTREQIRGAIVEALSAIAPEVDFATVDLDRPLRAQVDLDSFDFLNAIIGLHDKLGVDIPEQDYGKLATLNSTIEYLAGCLARAGRPADSTTA